MTNTRTEQGYAAWKEFPSHVAQARTQARGRIAARVIWRTTVESWAVPCVEWLNRLLTKKDAS